MARRLIEEDKAVADAFAAFNLKESSPSSSSSSMSPPIFKFN